MAPERSLFRNHAFAIFDRKIYDASTGPHLGTENTAEYMTSVIDLSTEAERQASADIDLNGIIEEFEDSTREGDILDLK